MSRAFWQGFLRGLAQPAVIWIWAIAVPLFVLFGPGEAPWWPYVLLSAICWLVIIRGWMRRGKEEV